MYMFKIKDAKVAIQGYLRTHPNSKVADKALEGDCAAMMELYEKICGPHEYDGGPTDEALLVLYEAYNRKYPPAMIRLAHIEMSDDIKYWPEGVMVLMEAYTFGSQEAMTQLKNVWHNSVKDFDARRKVGNRLNKYEEFVLAFYYHYGIEVGKDKIHSLHLFESSAKRGCNEAMKFLQLADK